MKKNDNSVFCGRPYKLRYFWKNFDYFLRECKWAWQRVTRGYSDLDWWNFDQFILKVLRDGLSDMAEYSIGCPCRFQLEYGNKAFDKWRDILLEMSKCFDDSVKDYHGLGLSTEELRERNEFQDARMKEGLDMLKEYMWNLWD